jgi:hypothetical protein
MIGCPTAVRDVPASAQDGWQHLLCLAAKYVGTADPAATPRPSYAHSCSNEKILTLAAEVEVEHCWGDGG